MPRKKNILAFSIAEAMIMLLIVSMIMAASAPLLSKRAIKNVESKTSSAIGYPDYSKGVQMSGSTFTISENGWLKLYRYVNDSSNHQFFINGAEVISVGAYKYGDRHTAILPVSKGDYCKNNGGFTVHFFPGKTK